MSDLASGFTKISLFGESVRQQVVDLSEEHPAKFAAMILSSFVLTSEQRTRLDAAPVGTRVALLQEWYPEVELIERGLRDAMGKPEFKDAFDELFLSVPEQIAVRGEIPRLVADFVWEALAL